MITRDQYTQQMALIGIAVRRARDNGDEETARELMSIYRLVQVKRDTQRVVQ